MYVAFVALVVVAFLVLDVTGMSYAALNGAVAYKQSIEEFTRTTSEIARTRFNVVDASDEPWADMLRLRLANSGQVDLAQFNKWDMVIGYTDGGGIHHERWLPFTDTLLDVNEWQKVGICFDGRTELFDPGIVGPGKEIVIGARLSPVPGPNSTVSVAMSTPNGVHKSTSFQVGSGYTLLTPHSENWTTGWTSYYQLKSSLAEGTGTIMTTADIALGQTGRWILHNEWMSPGLRSTYFLSRESSRFRLSRGRPTTGLERPACGIRVPPASA